MLDNPSDKVKQILKNAKYEYCNDGDSIGLKNNGLDCGDMRCLKDLESKIDDFIKSKTNEVQDLNNKIKGN